MSVCFHTSIVAISNSLNIKFESALFQFHWERKREGGRDRSSVIAAGNTCGLWVWRGRCISDYNLISDHYKVTTGLGCWWRSEAAGCELSLRMRGSWEDTASANRSRVLEMSDQSEARDTERERGQSWGRRLDTGPVSGHQPPGERHQSVTENSGWTVTWQPASADRNRGHYPLHNSPIKNVVLCQLE